MHGGQIRNRRLYCQRSRPVPKAVFRAGRGGQWVHYFVALVRESKGDHRGGGDEEYYEDNHVVLMEKDFEYTILMDEPDRNLDIDNIMDLYKVLSFHKPQTQIIAVIHNPALIYKLSKLDCVNFIEMTKGYLKKITGFMNKK